MRARRSCIEIQQLFDSRVRGFCLPQTIYHKTTISIQGEFANTLHAQVLATDYKISLMRRVLESETDSRLFARYFAPFTRC